jgi:cytochrome c553
VPVEVVAGEPEGRYIDASGHVWRTALTAPVAAGFVRWVRQLREGEAGYAIACARCHGAGGGDRSYPHIKPLPGIGGRLSREEIYRRLNPVRLGPGEISIRSHIFRPAQAEALVLYIAGL